MPCLFDLFGFWLLFQLFRCWYIYSLMSKVSITQADELAVSDERKSLEEGS
jgi:hypothetical protein